ncbi:MAG: DegQ family serine endoprotease [Verrucomicrobiota bacterium]
MIRKSKLAVLLLAAVAAGVILAAGLNLSPKTYAVQDSKDQAAAPATSTVRMLPVDIPALVKEVSPAVVNISTTQVVKFEQPRMQSPYGPQDPFEQFFNNFFGRMPREQKRRSLGSGFIVSDDGYILTNNHVVDKADEVTVTLLDKEEFRAKVVGTDPKTDIALIKISAPKKLPYVKLGDSEKLEVGEWVIAIGNPFGLGHTVTAGIVSAKGRIIGSGPYDDFIQTDASINPGNSGGPLFNLKGEVVGINSAIIQGGQGIGFATPISLAKSILEQLKDKGRVTRGWLGVYIQPLTPDVAAKLGAAGSHGALVSDVTKDGPAAKAGIRSGDVIVAFNGKEVRDERDLPSIVAVTKPGTKVDVKLVRDGKQMTIPVTVAEMKPSGKEAAGKPDLSKGVGLTVQDITPDIAKRFDITDTKGVIVTSVDDGSPADDAGMQAGDIIRQIDQKPVSNVAEFKKLMKRGEHEKSILFIVELGGNRMVLVVKVE